MIDWQSLVVTVAGRSAIYDESIPAALERAMGAASDPEAAQAEIDQRVLSDVLATCAGACGSLGWMGELGRVQYVGLIAGGVLQFIAVEEQRRPGYSVVIDIELIR